jgi:transposase
VLEPYIPYLIERWNAGCRNGTALWKEIIERGYTGKRVTVFSFVTRLRKALGIPAKNRTIRTGKVAEPDARPLTPRTVVWQVLERPDKHDAATIQRIAKFRQAHADLDAAITLTEGFAMLIRTRDPAVLDPWLEHGCGQHTQAVPELCRQLASRLRCGARGNRATVEHRPGGGQH